MAYLQDETVRALDVLRKITPGTHVEQLVYLLHRRLLDVESQLTPSQPTTAEPQTTAPTKEVLSDAQAPASTAGMTRPSSPLGTHEAGSGRAVFGYVCAHESRVMINLRQTPPLPHFKNKQEQWNWWCQGCGALMYAGEIRVPAAAPTSSTSVRQASSH